MGNKGNSVKRTPAGNGPAASAKTKPNGFSRLEPLWEHFAGCAFVIGLLFTFICLSEFQHNDKYLIVVCCVLSLLLCLLALLKRRHHERFSLPVLAVAVYLFVVALSLCWTCSGKFFLREFSKLLFVLPIFLLITFFLPKTERAVRNLLLVLCSANAVFAVFGVDLAGPQLTWPLLSHIAGLNLEDIVCLNGRLPGIFANSNITGGVHALGILLTFALLSITQKRSIRVWAVFLCALDAFVFIQGVNRSSTLFLLIVLFIALLCSGSRRQAFLLDAVISLVPGFLLGLFSLRFYQQDGSLLPLVFLLGSAAVSAVLELTIDRPCSAFLARHKRFTWGLILTLFGVIILFAVLALTVSGPILVSAGTQVERACYPVEGQYTLEADYDGDLQLRVYGQNQEEVVSGVKPILYSGSVQDMSIAVPSDCVVIYVRFIAEGDTVIRQAALRSEAHSYPLHMSYPLLPIQFSDRLTGLWASRNMLQRFIFFRDGMRVFRDYPILGGGMGAFESLIAGYQDFRYVTRYVHNHYVQVLLDNGIVGLLAYLFVLCSCLLCILQGRKQDAPFHEMFAPILAAFLMLVLHSFMDVIMSTTAYLPFAYALFALCALLWGKPLRQKLLRTAGLLAFAAISLAYTVLISLNIRANHMAENLSNKQYAFFNSLDTAVKIDAFDYNDWKISYLTGCAQLQAPEYKNKADRYAAELMDVPSNSLHLYLFNYYLSYQDYESAYRAAQNGVRFNYADVDTWNGYFLRFQQAIADNPSDTDTLRSLALDLYGEFEDTQTRLYRPIKLDKAVQSFIRELQAS